MRWLNYFILAYVALGLQIALGGLMNVGGVAPNLILPVALFLALHAPREGGLLGCFFLGLTQDLLTPEHAVGMYAVAYGLIGLSVHGVQSVLYREHPATHVSLAVIGSLITLVIVYVHGLLHGIVRASPDARPPVSAVTVALWPLVIGAVYTTLIAWPALWLLMKMRRLFPTQPGRGRGR